MAESVRGRFETTWGDDGAVGHRDSGDESAAGRRTAAGYGRKAPLAGAARLGTPRAGTGAESGAVSARRHPLRLDPAGYAAEDGGRLRRAGGVGKRPEAERACRPVPAAAPAGRRWHGRGVAGAAR